MPKPKIYIDGQAGTTGMEIRDRLKGRQDIELLEIPEDQRHDDRARKALMEQADLTFLCLPDQAAVEAVRLSEGTGTRLIDASTAHRTRWVYGFPELDNGQTEKIRQADKVANPGCHATGAIAMLHPLVQKGIIHPADHIQICSLTGYTGGGKKMVHDYEMARTEDMTSPQPYSLDRMHKHIPEIMKLAGLERVPLFVPIVDDYDRGMLVMAGLPGQRKEEVLQLYRDWYRGTDVEVLDSAEKLYANALRGTDRIQLAAAENPGGTLVLCRLDNLGKGACGAAIRNMEIMLGLDQ